MGQVEVEVVAAEVTEKGEYGSTPRSIHDDLPYLLTADLAQVLGRGLSLPREEDEDAAEVEEGSVAEAEGSPGAAMDLPPLQTPLDGRRLPSSSLAFIDPINVLFGREDVTALNQSAALFYAGGRGSGVSLHSHTNSWNALIEGRKRWYLLPPHAVYGRTGLPMAEWLDSKFYRLLKEDTIRCTQERGETLWVPQDWTHGVINVDDVVVGMAGEVGAVKGMGKWHLSRTFAPL